MTALSTAQSQALTETVTPRPSVTVVIPCYTDRRWKLLVRAIESARNQTVKPDHIVVVVDYNDELLARLTDFVTPDITLLANQQAQGVSGARNTAALAVDDDLIAFLDDDAEALPGWVENLLAVLESTPGVVGAGGTILADWANHEPWWFPREFGFVVGARESDAPDGAPTMVRNLWAANLIVDRATLVANGGFRVGFGKMKASSEPEDTELCLRLTEITGRGWVFNPEAVVRHHVPSDRETLKYFLLRCRMEGKGKASLAVLKDHGGAALADERYFLRRTLPRGFVRHLNRGLHGDVRQFGQAAVLVAGLSHTVISFAVAAGAKRLKRK